jgi:hypothetical protein
MGHPLWREDGSVIYLYNCFWALEQQSRLGASPAELTAIFYFLIWDSPNLEGQVPAFISPRNRVPQLHSRALGSLFVVSYDSQGYGGGSLTNIWHGLHTKHRVHEFFPCFVCIHCRWNVFIESLPNNGYLFWFHSTGFLKVVDTQMGRNNSLISSFHTIPGSTSGACRPTHSNRSTLRSQHVQECAHLSTWTTCNFPAHGSCQIPRIPPGQKSHLAPPYLHYTEAARPHPH